MVGQGNMGIGGQHLLAGFPDAKEPILLVKHGFHGGFLFRGIHFFVQFIQTGVQGSLHAFRIQGIYGFRGEPQRFRTAGKQNGRIQIDGSFFFGSLNVGSLGTITFMGGGDKGRRIFIPGDEIEGRFGEKINQGKERILISFLIAGIARKYHNIAGCILQGVGQAFLPAAEREAVQIGNVEDAEIFGLSGKGSNGDGFLFQADPAVIDPVKANDYSCDQKNQHQHGGDAGMFFSFRGKDGIP